MESKKGTKIKHLIKIIQVGWLLNQAHNNFLNSTINMRSDRSYIHEMELNPGM